jgi:cytochrome c oxidase cbb3-type subunit 1
MWISGIAQGLMWRTYNDMGNLQYSFIDVLRASHPLYVVRALGGLLFLGGACVMAYNFYKTINDKTTKNQLI